MPLLVTNAGVRERLALSVGDRPLHGEELNGGIHGRLELLSKAVMSAQGRLGILLLL